MPLSCLLYTSKNFITLLDLINASEAREDDETYQSPVDLLFSQLEEREPDQMCIRDSQEQGAQRWTGALAQGDGQGDVGRPEADTDEIVYKHGRLQCKEGETGRSAWRGWSGASAWGVMPSAARGTQSDSLKNRSRVSVPSMARLWGKSKAFSNA